MTDIRAPDRIEFAILNGDGATIGRLQQITAMEAADPTVVEDLTVWRNRNRRFFLTQFEATPKRTLQWLRDSVLPDVTRVMYLICDVAGTAVGHLGVRKLDRDAPELDNMIRGRAGGDPQLMFWAEVALIAWIFARPGTTAICLHVFSNNWIPIGIHQSIGFQAAGMRPLSKKQVGAEVHYLVESAEGEPQRFGHLRMTLDRSAFARFLAANTQWG